jgi:pilus assembly protein CpaB
MRAYTIKVSDVTGVGGHALPGDRVDVVLQRDLTPSGDTRTFVSEVVLQNVRVLGVDLNADLSANKPASPSTATLEVTVEDAQKLSVAADLGKLSLALRKTGAAEIAPVTPMLTRNVVTMGAGGGAVRSAPVASGSGGYRRPAASGGSSLIMIVEGDGRRGGARRAPAPRPAPAAPAASASAKPADA